MKFYAGIGSRTTPNDVLDMMRDIASELGKRDWLLRSGHADGADWAFEQGAEGHHCDIFLPWPTFNLNLGFLDGCTHHTTPQSEAYPIAEQFHPNWARCSMTARMMHARNVHQILGPDVTQPILSRFVICWTYRGHGGGGTGQALRIARHYNVPIFDLANQADYERIEAGLFAK